MSAHHRPLQKLDLRAGARRSPSTPRVGVQHAVRPSHHAPHTPLAARTRTAQACPTRTREVGSLHLHATRATHRMRGACAARQRRARRPAARRRAERLWAMVPAGHPWRVLRSRLPDGRVPERRSSARHRARRDRLECPAALSRWWWSARIGDRARRGRAGRGGDPAHRHGPRARAHRAAVRRRGAPWTHPARRTDR